MVRVSAVLEDMARDMVGDNGSPNLYFVSTHGPGEPRTGIFLVTSDFDLAYESWRKLPRDVESALEDRQNGTLASREPEGDVPGARLVVYDNTEVLNRFPSRRIPRAEQGRRRPAEVRVRQHARRTK